MKKEKQQQKTTVLKQLKRGMRNTFELQKRTFELPKSMQIEISTNLEIPLCDCTDPEYQRLGLMIDDLLEKPFYEGKASEISKLANKMTKIYMNELEQSI